MRTPTVIEGGRVVGGGGGGWRCRTGWSKLFFDDICRFYVCLLWQNFGWLLFSWRRKTYAWVIWAARIVRKAEKMSFLLLSSSLCLRTPTPFGLPSLLRSQFQNRVIVFLVLQVKWGPKYTSMYVWIVGIILLRSGWI